MKTLVMAVVVLLGTTACLPKVKDGDDCNNPGEVRLEGKEVFRCMEVPGEFDENFWGKKFPASRWKKMEAK